MKYDITIIGSGPGGYVAAIRCAQLGMKTALIEKYSTLGGTCLNVGCIPSKALLDSSEHFYNATKSFTAHGIDVKEMSLNWPNMRARKDKVVAETCAGVSYLMKKNKVDVLTGHGSFVNKNTISILKSDGSTSQIETDKVIIATGSKPASIPSAVIDKQRIISSTEALQLTEIPKEMIVIGAGVIGVEMGSVFARLGTKVKVIEYLDRVIPAMDGSMSKELERSLKKIGIEFYLSHKVTATKVENNRVSVTADDAKGQSVSFTADYCLVAVGRKPYTDKLGLEKIGLATDARGFIPVNEHLETSVEGIFAIGDVIGGAMLAHKAEEEGVYVAELLAGQKPHINYHAIPNVVYTWPEVASVGYSEEDLKKLNRNYKVGSFPYKALGRARAAHESEGMVKIIADTETDEVLGVHMIGARAADMIAEAVIAMEFRASAEDIARISHAHPTFTEAVREAALAATANRAIHA